MQSLDDIWYTCLDLAMDGIIGGSLGISALITTSE